MLNRLTVRNFKSLHDVTVELPQLAVLLDPNTVGKNNLPPGELPEMLRKGAARFTLEADPTVKKECYRYCIEPEIDLGPDKLDVVDECLATLTQAGIPKGAAIIHRVDSHFHLSTDVLKRTMKFWEKERQRYGGSGEESPGGSS